MKLFNCLIVDDEPIARDIIIKYCSHLPLLQVVAACGNAFEAKNILQEQQVQILFLDIHMPVLNGISFLNTLKKPPQVIFTTAYKEYATDAFDLAACDYLVKPFPLERFIVAVDKALERLSAFDKKVTQPETTGDGYIFIKADGKIYKIAHDELLYAEARGNYTKIVTVNSVITPGLSFTGIEKMLPAALFARVHRSFIINISKINHIEGNRLFINKTEIPIGSHYKEIFLKTLGLQ